MKKIIASLFFLSSFGTLGAEFQFRTFTEITHNFDGDFNFDQTKSDWREGINTLYGVGNEIVFNKIGLGFTGLVNFRENNGTQDWIMDFQGRFNAAFHFWGINRFIDPYGFVGVGALGVLDLSNGVSEYSKNQLTGLNMGIFTYTGLGANLNLDGLLVGGRFNWQSGAMAIPRAGIPLVQPSNFQFGLNVGLALGSEGKAEQEGSPEEDDFSHRDWDESEDD